MTSRASYYGLARKYRPSTLKELKGQEALVKTLTNAFALQRIASAFLLTGMRGVGKTTTARFIARALNCQPTSEVHAPTIEPCGQCNNCLAIAEDRHPDVLEMDAASRTSVNDIREIIDSVHYSPILGRYKIYIIDEVHMLSQNAFNALLKTLEEPPAHCKFIFATTEIRKIPLTIISRCQRFDLKRFTQTEMVAHLQDIATKEAITVESEALLMLAEASEGSARDGLSLLEQAIAYSYNTGTQEKVSVQGETVRTMLGLMDSKSITTLLDAIIEGNAAATVQQLTFLYQEGADLVKIFQELLTLIHLLTKAKTLSLESHTIQLSEAKQHYVHTRAEQLSIPALTRLWQLLHKALPDIHHAHHPLQTAEMALIKAIYAHSLPPLQQIVSQLTDHEISSVAAQGASSSVTTLQHPAPLVSNTKPSSPSWHAFQHAKDDQDRFVQLTKLFLEHKQLMLYHHLCEDVTLVTCIAGKLEIHLLENAPKDLLKQITRYLNEWTPQEWEVLASTNASFSSLKQQQQKRLDERHQAHQTHPVVQSVLEHFPDATIEIETQTND